MTGAHRVVLLRELTRQVAYRFWVDRGRPLGSAEVDWLRAEALLDNFSVILGCSEASDTISGQFMEGTSQ
jgi:hypothetical protein